MGIRKGLILFPRAPPGRRYGNFAAWDKKEIAVRKRIHALKNKVIRVLERRARWGWTVMGQLAYLAPAGAKVHVFIRLKQDSVRAADVKFDAVESAVHNSGQVIIID